MYAKILVPVDGSETSKRGLREAIKLAKNQNSQLVLFHIVNEFVLDYTFSAELYADQLLDSMRTQGQAVLDQMAAFVRQQGLQPECVLMESIGGAAGDLIVEQAKQSAVDLIVMGTHGRRGLRRLAVGSDAEAVIRSAPVPVLLVRDELPAAAGAQSRTAA